MSRNLSRQSMTSGRGGECASMSATGVPYIQTRERSKYDVEPRMMFLRVHLRQTWASLYHHWSTSVRGPIPYPLPRDGRYSTYPRLHLKEMADKDGICGGGSHHRGRGSTQYVVCYPWAV